MNTKAKLAALVAAGVLAFGAYGLAFAATGASDQGITPTWHDGNVTAAGNGNDDKANCDAADAVELGASSDSGTSANGVTVHMTYDSTSKAVSFTADGGVVFIAYIKGGNAYNEYDYSGLGGVASDGHLFAPDNGSDGPAGLSHAVFCTGQAAPPSFSSTEEPATDVPPTPSFSSTGEPASDVPSLVNTATIGAGTSGPSDSSWLFIAAIGVLLASVVVMTPARAKNRR